MLVYVLNRKEKPLMPCSPRKARLLLKSEQATVVHKTPFTIKLKYGSSNYLQHITASLDTGSKVVGCAAIVTGNNKVIYQSEVMLRNDISDKLTSRASFRRTRRAKNTRYRPARFNNRSASKRQGRLAPSIVSKIESHLREVKFVESILPVRSWKFELASFDIHKITNPTVSGKDYQNGDQKDFYNTRQYVLSRDGYTCQSKQKIKHHSKLHVHHIKFKSKGGSDAPNNLITLCETCHDNLHNNVFTLSSKTKRSKTKHATEIGIIKSQLAKSNVKHTSSFGYETKYKREQILHLPKTHANDAVAICIKGNDINEFIVSSDIILIKKHIAKGDYKQTSGAHSQLKIPTGKLFGLRKGDKAFTSRGMGFIKGKRTSGYFSIADLDNNIIHASEKVKNCTRMSARSTTLTEELKLTNLLTRRLKKDTTCKLL